VIDFLSYTLTSILAGLAALVSLVGTGAWVIRRFAQKIRRRAHRAFHKFDDDGADWKL
jgi:flagellar biogenesis protein FliO